MKKPDLYRAKDFPQNAEKFSENLYQQLIAALRFHGYLYYTQDDPLVDDQEYDLLYKTLKQVEQLHPHWVSPNSPSLKAGGEIKKEFPPANHEPPMLSLDNADDFTELADFDTRLTKLLLPSTKTENVYHAEPKFDGIAVELIYVNGMLVSGSTRGNGAVGEDITHNLRTVKNIPLRLHEPFPNYISIRGECVMPIQSFEKLNKDLLAQDKKPFANPRNAAAGSLRQQDSSITAQRNLFFFPYALGSMDSHPNNMQITLQSSIWNDFFPALGFAVSPLETSGTIEEIQNFYLESFSNRHLMRYDLDGIVVKYNDTSLWEKLGTTAKSPRYAIAYKYPAREAITRLYDVSFQVGRTGIVTPVAHLDAINIGGVIVQRASLHNADEIERLNIHVPCLVEVKRAGDVIPKVTKRILNADEALEKEEQEKSKKINFPAKCPSCNSVLIKEDVYVRCQNPSCSAKKIALLKYQVSRAVLDIDGLGEEWIEKLFALNLIKNLSDVFRLDEKKLTGIEGMGDILRKKILDSIAARKKISTASFLLALGIQGIGPKAAKTVAREFGSLEKVRAAQISQLEDLPDIGPISAQAIYNYFHEEKNIKELENLISALEQIEEETTAKDSPENIFAQKTFVFTGRLVHLERTQAQNLVESLGGKASSSVSKNTSYVVCGEKAGSKEKKAKELNIPILSEQEFLDMLPQEKTEML